MFTGIVEATGTVAGVAEAPAGRRIRLRSPELLEGFQVGGSVAVDGACLTAVQLHEDGFSVDVVPATLERTLIATYRSGTRVNLERPVQLGDRLDGHLVQGHVDGVGEVVAVRDEGESRVVDLSLPEEVDAVTLLHGSITVNGVSLTVSALPGPGRCQIALIPHTRALTNLGEARVGDQVNLEGDLIGKYVGRMLALRYPALATPSDSGSDPGR